ncbi:MAG: hypothetical protein ACYSWQ_28160 [Planctomycetota bacterium]
MKHIGIYGTAASTVILALLFAAGCTKPSGKAAEIEVEPRKAVETRAETRQQGQPVELSLKFVPADSTTYKVALETGKSVQWEGQAPKPEKFQGGRTSNRMEMTFSQQIQSVDDQGTAVAKITIKELKYVATIKDRIILDFDSSRETDRGSPLNNLIGQSYTIELTTSGQVSRIIDASDALAAASPDKTAVALLSSDAIRQRHTVAALPAAGENRLRTGENWSNLKSVSFDMMGSKSYERIYTLKEVRNIGNRRVAIAEMEAVPSVANARESHKEPATDAFSKMFDNIGSYTGELKLSLTDGKVVESREELLVEWFIVDPNPKKDEPPAALKMAATRLFSIARVD